jgi:hypothetical protein
MKSGIDKVISFPNRTGTVGLVAGSPGTVTYNNFGVQDGDINFLWNSTSGLALGRKLVVNETTSGFSGNLLDLQVNGSSKFAFTTAGLQLRASQSTATIANLSNFGLYIFDETGTYTTGNAIANFTNYFGLRIRQNGNNTHLGFTASDSSASPDVELTRDAANTFAIRRGTSAQKTNIYDTFTSSTDYHRIAIATARATLTSVSGASVTATNLIPAGAVVMGVTSKVTTGLGTTNGTTGYKIGTVADDDRWGAITGTAAGTTSDNRNWTAGTIECFPTATSVIVTATGGNFNATGVIYLSVQYMAGEAD